MGRPLTRVEAVAALRRGAPVEQFLSLAGERVTYLTAGGRDGSFVVRRHVVHDDGDEDHRDITEFSPVAPGEYLGEGAAVGTFDDPDAAVAAAADHGGRPDAWVNAGMAGDDYWRAKHQGA